MSPVVHIYNEPFFDVNDTGHTTLKTGPTVGAPILEISVNYGCKHNFTQDMLYSFSKPESNQNFNTTSITKAKLKPIDFSIGHITDENPFELKISNIL